VRGCDRGLGGGDRGKGDTNQISYTSPDRASPNQCQQRASPPIVCFTHALRTYLRRKKTNKRIQIEYTLSNIYSKLEKLFSSPPPPTNIILYLNYITSKTQFILFLHLNYNYLHKRFTEIQQLTK